jgi:hypothetical protein
MKKNILAFLGVMLLLSACAGPTPAPSYTIDQRPTPTVAYQIIGETKYTCMVVVDPASNTDRAGLQEIGDYLCQEFEKCKVWFWDDVNKADASYPVDPDKELTLIAYYNFDWHVWASELKVYTLGDAR